MDKNELHYITYDPTEIWLEMVAAYVEAGGDILYPGDEKELLLRGVQAIVTQVFAGVDNALRMQTLRYAIGEYLDLLGDARNCPRIEAQAAHSRIQITFNASGQSKTIAEGTTLTADGEHIYMTTESFTQTGFIQVMEVDVVCREEGSAGNGLIAGTQMQFMVSNPAVESVIVLTDAEGGQEREDDDTYRERIRLHGQTSVTTGPATQYENVAMSVSSEILDAKALNIAAGHVGVYVILKSDVGENALLAAVNDALSADDVRPLTDTVSVIKATDIPYTLNVQYIIEEKNNITEAVAAALSEYQDWQDNTIGRAFNPDRLIAALYQAGASRVTYADGSAFNGGNAVYTPIGANERCKGTISIGVLTE